MTILNKTALGLGAVIAASLALGGGADAQGLSVQQSFRIGSETT